MLEKVNLLDAAAELEDYWAPRTVDGYNGDHVQVIKVLGEYVWHMHDRTDDLFFVLSGHVTVQLRDGDIELYPGDLLVVPVGTEHRVTAEQEARLLVLEHLGDVEAEAGEPEISGSLFM